MKKVIYVLLIALAVTTAVSAQNYVVQEVTGRVERDAGGGKWEAVSVGDTLMADTVIRTVIGANLKIRNGEEILAVGPMKNGKISDIASGDSVIQIQGKVSQTNTDDVSRTTGRISTASARASDAAGDIGIEE